MKNFKHLSALCRESGKVLLAHANEPVGHQYPGKAPFGIELYYAMAKAAAGTKLILAHWGGGLFFFNLLKKEVPEVLENVYFDTAASPFSITKRFIRRLHSLQERERCFSEAITRSFRRSAILTK